MTFWKTVWAIVVAQLIVGGLALIVFLAAAQGLLSSLASKPTPALGEASSVPENAASASSPERNNIVYGADTGQNVVYGK